MVSTLVYNNVKLLKIKQTLLSPTTWERIEFPYDYYILMLRNLMNRRSLTMQ